MENVNLFCLLFFAIPPPFLFIYKKKSNKIKKLEEKKIIVIWAASLLYKTILCLSSSKKKKKEKRGKRQKIAMRKENPVFGLPWIIKYHIFNFYFTSGKIFLLNLYLIFFFFLNSLFLPSDFLFKLRYSFSSLIPLYSVALNFWISTDERLWFIVEFKNAVGEGKKVKKFFPKTISFLTSKANFWDF